jgi:c-di-AMP phosphodiesterase-like protein
MSDLFDSIQTFYQGNTEVSIAILIAIIIVLIVKPKAAGKLLVVIAAFIVIGYVIVTVTDLTGSAKDNKNEALHKTDREFHKSEE